jgi:cholest-4-en-3-one 26-monooxygenase
VWSGILVLATAERARPSPIERASRVRHFRFACAQHMRNTSPTFAGVGEVLTDIDVTSPDQWIAGVPHEKFATLRRETPVYRHRGTEGEMPEFFWALTRHEDVQAANRDVERFSSQRGGVLLEAIQSAEEQEFYRTIISTDEPEHTRLRRLVNRGFTPRAIATFELRYRDAVRQVLDRALAVDTFNFVSEIATPLPAFAISELLGVPVEEREQVTMWSNMIAARSDPEFGDGEAKALEAATGLYMYATQLAEERRSDPRDDIVTRLVTKVDDDDDMLGAHEFEVFVLALAVAGNETTRTAISQGMLALLQNPEQMDLLRANTSEHISTAADEVIRYASPIGYFRRTATQDIELHGVTIRENDPVALYYISANYDDTVFADPMRFDITRTPNPHVSFGGGGPHYCLGAHLAKLEIKVLFEELLAATDSIELAGEPVRLRSSWINGLKRLPVRVARSQP